MVILEAASFGALTCVSPLSEGTKMYVMQLMAYYMMELFGDFWSPVMPTLADLHDGVAWLGIGAVKCPNTGKKSGLLASKEYRKLSLNLFHFNSPSDSPPRYTAQALLEEGTRASV